MAPPFPDDTEQVIVGMGCFWGAEKAFWQLPGVYTTAVGYSGGITPNPTYEEVCSGRTGQNEVVLVVYRPAEVSFEDVLKAFWEGHDPTQGMRQGNDVGTQYRSAHLHHHRRPGRGGRGLPRAYQAGLEKAGHGQITTEVGAGGRVLLRRGLPPAVPAQGPERLLRPGRDRRELPGGPGQRLVASGQDPGAAGPCGPGQLGVAARALGPLLLALPLSVLVAFGVGGRGVALVDGLAAAGTYAGGHAARV